MLFSFRAQLIPRAAPRSPHLLHLNLEARLNSNSKFITISSLNHTVVVSESMCGGLWLVVITRKKREQKETKKKIKKKKVCRVLNIEHSANIYVCRVSVRRHSAKGRLAVSRRTEGHVARCLPSARIRRVFFLNFAECYGLPSVFLRYLPSAYLFAECFRPALGVGGCLPSARYIALGIHVGTRHTHRFR